MPSLPQAKYDVADPHFELGVNIGWLCLIVEGIQILVVVGFLVASRLPQGRANAARHPSATESTALLSVK